MLFLSWYNANAGVLTIECSKKSLAFAYLCIESCEIPQSTVRMPTPEARIGPMVDPHPISFLTTKSYIIVKWTYILICYRWYASNIQEEDENHKIDRNTTMLPNYQWYIPG